MSDEAMRDNMVLRSMVQDQIEREGSLSSFMIRSGLLLKILDDASIYSAPATPPSDPGEVRAGALESIGAAILHADTGNPAWRGALLDSIRALISTQIAPAGEDLLAFVLEHYGNNDLNHVDFRVQAYRIAMACPPALTGIHGETER